MSAKDFYVRVLKQATPMYKFVAAFPCMICEAHVDLDNPWAFVQIRPVPICTRISEGSSGK